LLVRISLHLKIIKRYSRKKMKNHKMAAITINAGDVSKLLLRLKKRRKTPMAKSC
jgi:hypothetical protein